MNVLRYVWENCGEMRLGVDISNITIEINHFDMKIIINTGKTTIIDTKYHIENKFDIIKISKEIDKVKLPKQKVYDYGGCDGFAWKLELDSLKYEGYLVIPDFLQEILDIIKFKDIFAWAKTKS